MVICGDQRSATGSAMPALQARHRLLQHLLVELEADLLDVAGLLVAEQVAGAADVEIVAGELEAGAERVERLQHLQPPLGLRGDLAVRRQREQRIGAQLRAPDPAAQLVELRQAEHVGAVDDQRVGGRDVEAGLDDGGRQQHVVLAVVERRHDVLELGRRHLAVRDRDLHLRHVLVEELLDARRDPRCAGRRRTPGRRDSARAAAPRAPPADRTATTKVRTASRSTGGVAMIDSSRTPVSASCSVRGIGVAVSVSTCTSARSSFSCSLCATPKCCSSSTMSRPRSLNLIALAEQRVGADDDVDRAVGEPFLTSAELLGGDQPRGLRDLAPASRGSAR